MRFRFQTVLRFGRGQQPREVNENDQPSLQLADPGQAVQAAFLYQSRRGFNLGARNLEHLRGGIHHQAEQLAIDLGNQNAVPVTGLSGGFAEALAQVNDGNDFAAQVNNAFQVVGRIGHGGNFRHADDFVHGGDGHAVGLAAHPETDNLQVLFHTTPSGSRSGGRGPALGSASGRFQNGFQHEAV